VNSLKQIVKKINFVTVVQVLLSLVLVTAPVLAVAQFNPGNNSQLCNGTGLNCQTTSVNGLIKIVINWLLGIAFGIAVLFLIIGGFWYITSAGNEETAEKGKSTAINAIIGIVIIIMSYVIINVISSLVSSPNSTTAP
jgi:amino acid transporter